MKSDDYFYADPEFKQRLSKVSKGTIVEVEDLAYTQSGIFRLKTAKGYLTAEFKQRLSKVSKGTIVEVEDLAYTQSGIFRLKTAKGYLTANKI